MLQGHGGAMHLAVGLGRRLCRSIVVMMVVRVGRRFVVCVGGMRMGGVRMGCRVNMGMGHHRPIGQGMGVGRCRHRLSMGLRVGVLAVGMLHASYRYLSAIGTAASYAHNTSVSSSLMVSS